MMSDNPASSDDVTIFVFNGCLVRKWVYSDTGFNRGGSGSSGVAVRGVSGGGGGGGTVEPRSGVRSCILQSMESTEGTCIRRLRHSGKGGKKASMMIPVS